jgi:hypothetical protein
MVIYFLGQIDIKTVWKVELTQKSKKRESPMIEMKIILCDYEFDFYYQFNLTLKVLTIKTQFSMSMFPPNSS